MTDLNSKAWRGNLLLFLVMSSLIFVSAGTLAYWQAWVFLGVYFSGAIAITFYMVRRDADLLARRMSGGPHAEKQPIQKIIMSLVSIGFLGLLLIPALDRRFVWSDMAPLTALAGDALVAAGWVVMFFVFQENTYGSATIELAPDQKVVSTGPYALVRHPMYLGGLIILAGIPIALGSWWGCLAIFPLASAIVWRLIEEEKFLARDLPGYSEYQQKVSYRLLPFIW